jgi:syntaxin-binding protein 1
MEFLLWITRADISDRNMDKVRVIALYIIFRDGVPEEDRRRLYEHSKLSRQERAAVDNLIHMHVRITRVGSSPPSGVEMSI